MSRDPDVFIVTIINLQIRNDVTSVIHEDRKREDRGPGMKLMRMPVFELEAADRE